MKKSLNNIFDEANAGEIENLVDQNAAPDVSADTLSSVKNKVYAKTHLKNLKKEKKAKSVWMRVGAIAACFVLLLSIGVSTYVYAADVREYNAAVKFFDEHDLSTEGLSRGEIKKVYRDIITESFTYSKTAEVILNSLTSEQIKGTEILQDDPTPEDVAKLWDHKNYNGWFVPSDKSGIHYERRHEYVVNGPEGYRDFDKSYLEKYDGDTLIWSVTIPEFYIWGICEVSDGVIAYGEEKSDSYLDTNAWMAKYDKNGALIWKKMINAELNDEFIQAVLENADGSYTVFSCGNNSYLCVSQYSADGQRIFFNKTEAINSGNLNATHFGDGYIVQLRSCRNGDNDEFVKIDHEGNATESFSYSSEDTNYTVTDMIEFNGKLYLSAYAVPKLTDEESNLQGWGELARVLDYLFTNHIHDISSEELTPMVRENYTAVLLACDFSSGTPQEFYSVDGSMGGKLSLSESGELLWNVESITTTFFSPATSSFTIGGTCYVFRYTFNESGALVNQEKTDEVTNLRK